MFKWRVPLWRRWDWHRWRRAYIARTPREDRRAWVRYPCNMETACQTDADVAGCSAAVRNISLGGMNLIVDRAFESGTLLRVEVQSSLENTPQMLCVRVIHVVPQPDGTWSLGCAFARELGDHGLRAFRAVRVRALPPDQRGWLRSLCHFNFGSQRADAANLEPATAKVLNIAPAGIGLMLARPFALGTMLSLELPTGDGDCPTTMLARVVHSKPHRNGDWLIGCAFAQQLTEEQLQALD